MFNKILRKIRSVCFNLMILIVDIIAEYIINFKNLRTYYQSKTSTCTP